MNNYNFDNLDPIRFEELVNDLLELEYDVRVERFKEGKDLGVDGRFNKNGENYIIQSKHYLKTGFSGLINVLKNVELEKVRKLRENNSLSKYILATSINLSRSQKDEIFSLFSGYINTTTDIYGGNELKTLLSKNKKVEEKFIELYITSNGVLERVLGNVINNGIILNSKHAIEEFIEKSRYFYETPDFNKALKIINDKKVLILSGEPGIGKSMLSGQLCLNLVLNHGYNFFKITDSVSKEALSVFKDNEKQIFYFDDFLGSNYIDKVVGSFDTEIKNFIKKISKSENKIFILNSRTSILNSLKINTSIYEVRDVINDNEFLLEINNLSNKDKAYILYKHIFFSNLDDEFLNKICENRNYDKIIKHDNFNPRLIEFVTNSKRVEECLGNPDDYIEFIQSNLNNPEKIWENVFENQSNDYVNQLVYLTVFNGGKIGENDLIKSYNCFAKKIGSGSISAKNEFKNIVKIALKNFLVRSESKENEFEFSLFNPSITDYILNKYVNDLDFLIDVVYNLGTYNGLKELSDIFSYKLIGKNNIKAPLNIKYKLLIKGILKKGLKGKDINYKVYLLFMLDKHLDKKVYFNYLVSEINEIMYDDQLKEISKVNASDLLMLLYYYLDKLNIKNNDFLDIIFNKVDYDDLNIGFIGYILDQLEIDDEDLLEIVEDGIKNHFINECEDLVNDFDYDSYKNLDDEDGLGFDIEECEKDIIYNLDGKISNYIYMSNSDIISNMSFDSYDIFYSADLDLEENFNDYMKPYEFDTKKFTKENIDSINENKDSYDQIFENFKR